ncbi:LysR family transcriptional regulator [Enterobacter hormaechei]
MPMIKEPNLEIAWLKTFLTVARLGSMTDATNVLCRSQSAISMHIKNIEDNLGRKVFRRGDRKLTLTPAGEELLQHASNIMAVYHSAMRSLSGSDVRGRITLGIPDDYAMRYLPPVLNSFSEKYPNIEISLICEPSSSLIPKTERGEIDVAIITRNGRVTGEHLFNEPLVWVGSQQHHLLNQTPLPIAIYEQGSEARDMVINEMSQRGIDYRIVYSSPYVAGQIAAVESGMAVTVLTRCCVPEHLAIIKSDLLPQLKDLQVAVLTSGKTELSASSGYLVREIISVLGRF